MTKQLHLKNESKNELLQLLDAYCKAINVNMICSITDAKGTIIYANERFCEISKFSEEELIGQNHRIVNSGHHSKLFFENLWQTITKGKVWQGEVKCKAKDGSYFWLDSTILPIFDESGNIIQYFSLRIPINEKKKMEEEREERTKKLEEMLFMISHNLRTPITQILGLADLFYNSNLSLEEINEIIRYINTSVLSLDTFSRELTTFISEMKLKHQKN